MSRGIPHGRQQHFAEPAEAFAAYRKAARVSALLSQAPLCSSIRIAFPALYPYWRENALQQVIAIYGRTSEAGFRRSGLIAGAKTGLRLAWWKAPGWSDHFQRQSGKVNWYCGTTMH